MDITRLLLCSLAVLFAWETFRQYAAFPGFLNPLAVAALAYVSMQVSDTALWICAIAGAVGVLHRVVNTDTGVSALNLSDLRRSRGVGQRVPPLP